MSSKKSKWMYHFSVPKKVKEEVEIDPIKDDEGNEIKQVKTITKTTPLKCAILKPTRKLFEEGELYYSVELSKYIQAGLLTKTLLAKRFANDGGVLTEDDQKHYSELYSSLTAKEQEIQRLQLDASLSSKKRAKKLQSLDSDFHVFVGQVGYWLPWDPCADKIEDEQYINWIRLNKQGTQVKRINKMTLKEGKRKFVGKAA